MRIISSIYNTSIEQMKNSSLLKPPPLPGFYKEKVIYIPVDTPSRFIYKSIKERIKKTKDSPFGRVFLLEDKIVLYRCVGAPTAIMSIERLIASGTRDILVLGFCGSLSRKMKILDAVSIQKAFSDEGTSKHYYLRKKTFSPSQKKKEEIEFFLKSKHLPFKRGTIVSTDAPYRETANWLKSKKTQGIDLVDMEASAVFAVASYHNIQAAALMLVSDELTSRGHHIGFHQPKTEIHMKKYFLPFLVGRPGA